MVSVIHTITTGPWHQNGYIIEAENGSALIIDPGSEPERFCQVLNDRALEPVAILNTHAHYDHIGAVCELMDRYDGLSFFLHGHDRSLLRQANLYRSLFGASAPIRVPASFENLACYIETGLELADFRVECIATPGHTKGGVCFRIGQQLFTGDTLLLNGPGRTDLPGGSATQIQESIQRLLALPGDLEIYPGHGDPGPLGSVRSQAASTSLLAD